MLLISRSWYQLLRSIVDSRKDDHFGTWLSGLKHLTANEEVERLVGSNPTVPASRSNRFDSEALKCSKARVWCNENTPTHG